MRILKCEHLQKVTPRYVDRIKQSTGQLQREPHRREQRDHLSVEAVRIRTLGRVKRFKSNDLLVRPRRTNGVEDHHVRGIERGPLAAWRKRKSSHSCTHPRCDDLLQPDYVVDRPSPRSWPFSKLISEDWSRRSESDPPRRSQTDPPGRLLPA